MVTCHMLIYMVFVGSFKVRSIYYSINLIILFIVLFHLCLFYYCLVDRDVNLMVSVVLKQFMVIQHISVFLLFFVILFKKTAKRFNNIDKQKTS